MAVKNVSHESRISDLETSTNETLRLVKMLAGEKGVEVSSDEVTETKAEKKARKAEKKARKAAKRAETEATKTSPVSDEVLRSKWTTKDQRGNEVVCNLYEIVRKLREGEKKDAHRTSYLQIRTRDYKGNVVKVNLPNVTGVALLAGIVGGLGDEVSRYVESEAGCYPDNGRGSASSNIVVD